MRQTLPQRHIFVDTHPHVPHTNVVVTKVANQNGGDTSMSDTAQIDFSAVEAEIQQLSQQELIDFVLKNRVKTKVQVKKQAAQAAVAKEKQKVQRQLVAAKQKTALELMKHQPSPDGDGSMYDYIERLAEAEAAQKLAEEQAKAAQKAA
jgi:hypothetical protein